MIGRILHTFIAWCAAKRTQWMCYMWPQDVCSAQQFYIVSRPPLSCIKSDGWWLMNERLQGHFHRRMLHFWRVDLNMFFSYGMPEITSASQFMGFRFYGEHGFASVRESYFINFRFFFIICLPILVSYCCDCEHICNNNNNRKVKTTVNFLYPFIWIVIFVVWNNWRTTH